MSARKDINKRKGMHISTLEDLRELDSRMALADILGYSPRGLNSIVYYPKYSKYSKFTVPKKNGSLRTIYAPNNKLKRLQEILGELLVMSYDEILEIEVKKLEEMNPKRIRRSVSHGFRRDHSIFTNAYRHRHKKYVFNFDLKDFFPSITAGRVSGYLQKNHHFLLQKKVADTIAHIATHENQLPQGASTSPVISNLIGHILDVRLVQLAKKHNCTYSRYADDITFSTNKKDFPTAIATFNNGEWKVGHSAEKIVLKAGFEINETKTRMALRYERQTVTGLVVNTKTNVRQEYYRKARAMCNSLFNTGDFTITGKINPTDIVDIVDEREPQKLQTKLLQLRGILDFTLQAKYYSPKSSIFGRAAQNKTNEKDKVNTLKFEKIDEIDYEHGIGKLFRRFMFYKLFAAPLKPLIICEGAGDVSHINLALKNLYASFPNLIERKVSAAGAISFPLKVKFYSNKKTTNEILDIELGNGTSQMPKFIQRLKVIISLGHFWEPEHPVIILVDNDSGAHEIFKAIGKANNSFSGKNAITLNSNDDFYKIYQNLYLIKLPTIKGLDEHCIERLYDDKTLNMKFGSKTFDWAIKKKVFKPKNGNSATNYTKDEFITEIVRPNQQKIDFKGFEVLLERIEKVISDHV